MRRSSSLAAALRVALAMLSAACSSTDSIEPAGAQIDSTDANRIEVTVASAPPSDGFIESDTVRIVASVVSHAGAPIETGEVTWHTQPSASVEPRGTRTGTATLAGGSNVVTAFFRNRSGVMINASITIVARAGGPTMIVWQPGGSTTEIPAPQNAESLEPRAINDRGEVVGTARLGAERRAFIWSADRGLRIIAGAEESSSEGLDINDDGIVAGYRRIGSRFDGFLWNSVTAFISLGDARAIGINSAGTVAGMRRDTAVRWSSNSGFELLPFTARGKCSRTTAIGGAGHVIGWVGMGLADGWCFDSSPVLWDPAGAVHTIHDCGAQTECAVTVVDVNDKGEVAGNNGGQPFRWSQAAGFRELVGDATGAAYGINDNGEIAGSVDYPLAVPTVWDRNAVMRSLRLPRGRSSGTARAINNKGQVVGVVR